MKRTIKVKFMDFWKSFNPEESIFYQVLSEEYDVRICEDADYIFFSSFDDQIVYEPENKSIKIFYTGENECPNFNVCDYGMGFDHLTMDDRYFRLPVYYNSDFYRKATERMEHKHEGIADLASLNKTGFCSFVVSNAKGVDERRQMFEALSRYKTVSSGGRWLNNVGGPVADKLAFESQHKFSLCFDNCMCRGYTTEKIVEAFAAQTIPIYWGDPMVTRVFNPRAFINVMDFPTFEAAIERVKELDQNEELYMGMLREKALLHDEDSYENTRQRLKEWLCHIMNQPIEEAHRTGNGFWHTDYYWKQRNYKYAFDHPFRTALRRLKSKWI